jgi:GNAT superfamily N-acetyltransferase
MGNRADITVRGASPQDAEAVSALLEASYSSLMALGYEPTLFARALPLLTKANPMLLSSCTWYVVEALDAEDRLVGCGGWARQRPDVPNEPVDPVLGHIRHFATHPNWTRRGIGRALFDRCVADARAAGVIWNGSHDTGPQSWAIAFTGHVAGKVLRTLASSC